MTKRNEQMERLDQLIHLKATGTTQDLARRFGICERSIYNLLNDFRNAGAEIAYCGHRNTYYYVKPIRFVCAFVSEEDYKKIAHELYYRRSYTKNILKIFF